MIKTVLNITELKNANRHRILNILRRKPTSRAELSQKTGLAKSSVTTLTNQMIEEGLLFEMGPGQKGEGAGRTPILLDIVADYGFAVGINLHRNHLSLAALNLKGRILFEARTPTEVLSGDAAAMDYIKTTITQKAAENGLPMDRLVGIGVSAPGPLDLEGGRILEPPNFELFNNLNVSSELFYEFACPVFLENDAVTYALYEHYYHRPQRGSTLFVIASEGIGSALMQNGQVFRGSHGIAGELGHVSIDPAGEECPCGNRGCLERYVSLSALKRRFGFEQYSEIADRAENGDPEAARVLEFLISTLGSALVSAVNLFDLDRIVLMGEYSYKPELITLPLQEYIKSHSVVCRVHSVAVSVSHADETAAPAAVPAINGFFGGGTKMRAIE